MSSNEAQDRKQVLAYAQPKTVPKLAWHEWLALVLLLLGLTILVVVLWLLSLAPWDLGSLD